MRKLTAALTVATALTAVAVAPTAQASNCRAWACMNRQLNYLSARVNQDERTLNCLKEIPVTLRGNNLYGPGGYVYHDSSGSSYQTALDIERSTDPVDAYMVIDGCRSNDLVARVNNLVARVAQALIP